MRSERYQRRILAEIDHQAVRPPEEFDRATADLIPRLQGMEEIYWRCLVVALPADTYPARFP